MHAVPGDIRVDINQQGAGKPRQWGAILSWPCN